MAIREESAWIRPFKLLKEGSGKGKLAVGAATVGLGIAAFEGVRHLTKPSPESYVAREDGRKAAPAAEAGRG